MSTPEQEASLDRELKPFPVDPLPRAFVSRTMARIEAEHAASSAALWRPSWGFLDVALPAFAALIAFVVALASLAAWQGRDPMALASIDAQVSLKWLLWTGDLDAHLALLSVADLAPVVVTAGIALLMLVGVLASRRVTLPRGSA